MEGLVDIGGGLADRVNEYYARMRGTVGYDYDYSKAPIVADSRGHYTDAGKLPTHPTFSVDSAYSNDKTPGGVWSKGPGQQTYTPSAWMVQQGLTKGLADYMAAREPNTVLLAPAPYSMNVMR